MACRGLAFAARARAGDHAAIVTHSPLCCTAQGTWLHLLHPTGLRLGWWPCQAPPIGPPQPENAGTGAARVDVGGGSCPCGNARANEERRTFVSRKARRSLEGDYKSPVPRAHHSPEFTTIYGVRHTQGHFQLKSHALINLVSWSLAHEAPCEPYAFWRSRLA